MLEIVGEEAKSLVMDHHGLVAAVCRDLGIAEKIDQRLCRDPQRVVSPGQAVVAMLLNGLGFTNRRLYLTHQFFQTDWTFVRGSDQGRGFNRLYFRSYARSDCKIWR